MRYRVDHLPADFVPPVGTRSRRRPGRPYVADVVESVRVLVESTTLSMGAIAHQTGIGVGTVHAWIVRRRWQRPLGAAASTRSVAPRRASFGRRLRLALLHLAALAERDATRLAARDPPDVLGRQAALDVAEAARRTMEEIARPARASRTKDETDAL